MTKFKCKISDLEIICKLISAKGKNIDGKEYRAIADMLINVFKPNRLEIKAMDIQGTFAISLNYTVDSVEEEGPLPIGDIDNFEQFLTRFNLDDIVNVSTTENKIIIERSEPKKTSRIPKASIDIIQSKNAIVLDKLQRTDFGFDGGKIKYDLSMTAVAEDIKNIIEDGNVVKQRILPWRVENNKLYISIGSETLGQFETEITFENVNVAGKTSTAFGNGIDNIFGNLLGKVKIYLANNVEVCPLIVEQDNEKFKYFAILAPYVMKE